MSTTVNPIHAAAAVEVEMQVAIQQTMARSATARPSNTKKAYEKRQQEFLAWCDAKAFPAVSRHTVSGEKLHLFLVEKVINRPVRKKETSRRKNGQIGSSAAEQQTSVEDRNIEDAYEEDDNVCERQERATVRVGVATVELYIAAIVDLWSQQVSYSQMISAFCSGVVCDGIKKPY